MSSVEQILEEVRRDGRICPQPQVWNGLHKLLCDVASPAQKPPPPLILAAWFEPHLSKILRLREQIEWADKHNCLVEVSEYLDSLPEESWYKGE